MWHQLLKRTGQAAREHLTRAQNLFDAQQYFLAHYVSGLAVECHLRAYLRRVSDDFDPRHDLAVLAVASQFNIVPRERANEFSGSFFLLNQRWRASHRYYSERQLLDYMTDIRADFGQKGDRWKNLSRAMLTASYAVIRQGEAKWDDWHL